MKSKDLISLIRSVLFEDWDPVGVGHNLNVRDEYDGYIGSVITTLSNNPSVQSIAALLERIETTEMGIDNIDVKRLNYVAEKLKKIGDTYFASEKG